MNQNFGDGFDVTGQLLSQRELVRAFVSLGPFDEREHDNEAVSRVHVKVLLIHLELRQRVYHASFYKQSVVVPRA